MFDNTQKMGKSIDEIHEGDNLSVTETIEDNQLLIYLGLTNDSNPLFIQNDYAQTTEYRKPIVPSIMLTGIMTSTISKHLPGPGSNVVNLSANFLIPIYHYETITFEFEVIKVDKMKEVVTLTVDANNAKGERVLDAVIMVKPPKNMIIDEDE